MIKKFLKGLKNVEKDRVKYGIYQVSLLLICIFFYIYLVVGTVNTQLGFLSPEVSRSILNAVVTVSLLPFLMLSVFMVLSYKNFEEYKNEREKIRKNKEKRRLLKNEKKHIK